MSQSTIFVCEEGIPEIPPRRSGRGELHKTKTRASAGALLSAPFTVSSPSDPFSSTALYSASAAYVRFVPLLHMMLRETFRFSSCGYVFRSKTNVQREMALCHHALSKAPRTATSKGQLKEQMQGATNDNLFPTTR